MSFAYGQTVTVSRPKPRDAHGDPTGEPATHQVEGVGVGPRFASEADGRARDGSVEGVALYGPYELDIRNGDQVVIDDGPYAGTWRVDGEPAHWRNPFTGWEAGTVAPITRAKG